MIRPYGLLASRAPPPELSRVEAVIAVTEGRSRPYRIFVVRCWYEGEVAADQVPEWRFSLQSVSGDKPRVGFASFEELCNYLRKELYCELPETYCEQGNVNSK